MFRQTIFILTMLLPGVVLAGSATGQIGSIYTSNNSSVVLFTVNGELQDSPRCNEKERFAIATTKKGGVNVYRAILEAKARGYTVAVKGLNTCSNEWKSEDVWHLEIR